MNKKSYVAGLMVLALLTVGIPMVFAHGHGGGGMRGGGQGCTGMFFHKAFFVLKSQDKLGLSKEQVDTIQGLKLEAEKNMIRQEAEIRVLELDIHSQLRADKADAAAIQKLIDQKYEAEKAGAKAAVDAYLKLKSTLNEKQWATLKDLKKEWMKKSFGEEGGHGGHYGHHESNENG